MPKRAKLYVQTVHDAGTTPPDEDVLRDFFAGHGFRHPDPDDDRYMIRD